VCATAQASLANPSPMTRSMPTKLYMTRHNNISRPYCGYFMTSTLLDGRS
jgi:hypothetical protein